MELTHPSHQSRCAGLTGVGERLRLWGRLSVCDCPAVHCGVLWCAVVLCCCVGCWSCPFSRSFSPFVIRCWMG